MSDNEKVVTDISVGFTAHAAAYLYGTAHRAANGELGVDSAIVAVTFSVMALEASLNDLLDECAGGFSGSLDTIVDLTDLGFLDKKSIKERVRLFGRLLNGEDNPFSRAPFQDLDILVAVRNTVVHLKPERGVFVPGQIELEYNEPKLAAQLSKRTAVPVPTSGHRIASMAQDIRTARWAWGTALAVAQELAVWFRKHGRQTMLAGMLPAFGVVVDSDPSSG